MRALAEVGSLDVAYHLVLDLSQFGVETLGQLVHRHLRVDQLVHDHSLKELLQREATVALGCLGRLQHNRDRDLGLTDELCP